MSHWKLDETSGTVASNEVVGAPAGQVGGGLIWTAGPVDGSAEFNGSNTRIYIPSTITTSSHWTWAMWLYYDTIATNYDSILSTNAWAVGTGMHCILRSNGAFAVGLNTGGADDQTQSQGTMTSGVWHHIAWTYDATAAEAKFYIDGQLDVTRVVDNPIAMTMGPSTLGAWNAFGGGYQRWLDGGLDDVRIYNETLTEGDIQALYLGPNYATHPTPTNNHPGVDPDVTLNWWAPEAFPTGSSYNVYLTDNEADLPSSLPLVSAAQAETSFDPELEPGVPYWWRVEVIAPGGQGVYTGPIWSFTTLITPEGCYNYPQTDLDIDCDVDLDDIQQLAAAWMACGKVPDCKTDETMAGSLLAYWKFDNSLANETGSALDGVGVGASPAYTAGMDGQALDLQGNNAAAIPEIGAGDEFTIAFWVNFDAFDPTGAAMPLVSTDITLEEPLYGQTPHGEPAYPAVALSVSPVGGGVATYQTGQWYHLACVYDRAGGTLEVYINGHLVSTSSYPTAYPLKLGPLMVGARNNNGVVENFLDGKIDDLRVYSQSLSAVQVATLYTALQPGETICAEVLPADINGDCVVDFVDFSLFTTDWLDCRIVPDCMTLP
ncbi:MAG: LamG domain-containing protein [Sedimentisphaerales bacterium]|nr:LamG domain-containing protein [Sedimentisphaerales bacterium]